jgi:hypothetical protein
MAGTLTISTLSDGTNSTSSTDCIKGSARAWVSYDSSGTVLKSYNVSSVTINGTGYQTITFTNALADANYVFAGTTNTPGGACVSIQENNVYTSKSTTALGVQTGYAYSTYTYYNFSKNYVVFFD